MSRDEKTTTMLTAATVVGGVLLGYVLAKKSGSGKKGGKCRYMKDQQDAAPAAKAEWTGWSYDEAAAHSKAGAAEAAKRVPADVLADLQRGNARFWTGSTTQPELSTQERRAMVLRQYPSTAILTCADSRVPPEMIFDKGMGDLFVIRAAGNSVEMATGGSIEFACLHLHCKVLMVMGHEKCGAVAASRLPTETIKGDFTKDLSDLLMDIKGGLDESRLQTISDERAVDREAVVSNVRAQLRRLCNNDKIMAEVKNKQLIIVGAFYEISTGFVDVFTQIASGADADALAALVKN